MNNGFNSTLDYILKHYGMKTGGIIGTTIGGLKTRNVLRKLGYIVEQGISKSNYDFVFISKRFSYLEYIRNALTKVDNGCIIIFRINAWEDKLCMCEVENLGHKVKLYEFLPNQYFGVITKGLKDEG